MRAMLLLFVAGLVTPAIEPVLAGDHEGHGKHWKDREDQDEDEQKRSINAQDILRLKGQHEDGQTRHFSLLKSSEKLRSRTRAGHDAQFRCWNKAK